MTSPRKTTITLPLPIVQGIADVVYKATPTPLSVKECEDLIAELKARISDIHLQILGNKENKHETPEEYNEWRKSAFRAIRFKGAQVAILKQWRIECLRLEQEKSKDEEIKSLRQEINKLRRERKEYNDNFNNEFLEDPRIASKVLREMRWLRYCLGELYDAVFSDEGIIDEEVKLKLKSLADALSYRD